MKHSNWSVIADSEAACETTSFVDIEVEHVIFIEWACAIPLSAIYLLFRLTRVSHALQLLKVIS